MLYLFSSLELKSLLYFCIIGGFVIKTRFSELINERNLL